MPGVEHLEGWSHGGYRGLVRAGWGDLFEAEDPVAWLERNSTAVVRDRRAVRVYRCETARGVLYGKVLTGASNARDGETALLARVKWTLRRSRTVAAMRACDRMEAAGIRCAPVVLAARRRAGLRATDVLVTREVPGPGLMTILRRRPAPSEGRELVRSAARAIARLHDAGFMHGDLHPDNIIPSGPEREMWFIDNDRTRWWRLPLARPLRERNLSQMGYRLGREFEGLLDEFLDEYLEATRLEEPAKRRLERGVVARVERRLAWLAAHRSRRDGVEKAWSRERSSGGAGAASSTGSRPAKSSAEVATGPSAKA